MKQIMFIITVMSSLSAFSFELPCHLKLAREILSENKTVQNVVINIIEEAERLESAGKMDEAQEVLNKSKKINYKIHELSNEVCSNIGL